jgi:hypothetical protein
VPVTAPAPSSPGHVDELELDVVGIAEHDDRIRHRIGRIDDPGILDTEAIELACPGVEVGAAGDRERHVVQARAALVEGLARVAVVVMQPDRDTRARLSHRAGWLSAGEGPGRPNRGRTLVSKRVIAPIRSPDRVRTNRPEAWLLPSGPRT